MAHLTSTALAAHPDHTPPADATGPTRPHDPSRRLGWIVVASLLAGLGAAAVLALSPFVPAQEHAVTGAVLCGFGFGWAMLAVLSARLTDRPQRWAAAPATLLGLGGLLLWAVPAADPVLSWVWPPAALATAIWMALSVRRDPANRPGRWLIHPAIALLAIAAIGGSYQAVQQAMDARAYPAPGELIDVGGHRLHLDCTGSGAPTVVLEPGAGGLSSTMGWITPLVARNTRVCIYDRAGRGWSEPADTAQDAAQIATDLHELLAAGNVPGPYVLAGHSFGGLYVLTYAAQYPDEVAGVVLIDSTAPNSQPTSQSPGGIDSPDIMNRLSAAVSATARIGLGNLFGQLSADGLPPQSEGEVRSGSASVNAIRSTIDEYAYGGASAREAGALHDLADKPLIVVTAGREHPASWFAAQDRLAATLSSNSDHRIIADATHASLVAEEKPAASTTQAILDIVAAVRDHQPLRK